MTNSLYTGVRVCLGQSSLEEQNWTNTSEEPFQVGMCGSLNVCDLHKLTGSGIINRCGFVGVGMALEEVCHYGGRLRSLLDAQAVPMRQTTSCYHI